jgi:molybdopterin converting factor small subunit
VEIVVKLGSVLRESVPRLAGGEGRVVLSDDDGVTVGDLMTALQLRPDEVKVIYRNHVLVDPSARLDDGDRVALFPPSTLHFSHFYVLPKGS